MNSNHSSCLHVSILFPLLKYFVYFTFTRPCVHDAAINFYAFLLSSQIGDIANSLTQKQNLILIESQSKIITGNGASYREANYNVAKDGYAFIGVGGWAVGNVAYNLNCIKKNGQLYVMAQMLNGSTWSGTLNFGVEIIYQKNS